MKILKKVETKAKQLKALAQRFTVEKAIKKAKKTTEELKLLAQKHTMSKAEWKKSRAALFSHWYYTTDLGDGVVCEATIPNEKACFQGLMKNRSHLLYMIDTHIGDVSGLKILDLACSAGLHAFELARRGAIVTGIDWDSGAIKQAKFVQECIKDQFKHPVKFHCISLFDFECAKNHFDYVYCSGLMYHLQNPIGAAQKIRDFCSKGVIISSCVTPKEGELFELSDPAQFPFCGSWEFALVPTATMIKKVFEYAGFKIVGITDWDGFQDTPGLNFSAKSANNSLSLQGSRGPVYLVGKV